MRKLLYTFLLIVPGWALAQVSGTVFQDYNANGQRNTTNTINAQDGNPIPLAVDQGVVGVTVTAYNAAGISVGTATTLADGTYTIPSVSGTVRIEFTNLPSSYYSGPIGSQNSTSIRFITAPATNVDFGVNRFQDYSQDNPNYAFGLFNPLSRTSGTYATNASVGIIPSTAGSTVYPDGNTISPPGYNQPAMTPASLYSETGTVWGLGWQRSKKTLYASAFIKQFTDLGAGGTGAIYKIDLTNPATPVTSLFVDLNALFGAGTSGDNPFVPYPNYNLQTERARVGLSVGKVALGDVEVSEDDKWLYVSNLKDHKIYSVPIDGSPVNSSTIVVSPKIPFPVGYTDEQVISHAVAVHNGKVYISATALRTEDPTGLLTLVNYTTYNYIYEYDPVTNTFSSTPVLDYNWNNDPYTYKATGLYISDFVFTPDGGMMLTFRYSYSDGVGGTSNSYLLRACPNGGGTWQAEAWNGACGGSGTAGLNDNSLITYSPPGAGLWYYQTRQAEHHSAASTGGLVQIPGFPYATSTSYDPFSVYTTGLLSVKHSDGTYVKSLETGPVLYIPGTDGVAWDNKRGVIGDIEVLSDPAPIEIGNRVWLDTDNDGIQDAGEAGISGVQVQLIKSGTTISTVTTDANGNYYFSSATGTDSASADYGITQLVPNMAYTVRFPTTATVSGTTYNLTTAAAGSNRLIDSNAPANGDVTILATDIPVAGANNHSFDVGYSAATCSINSFTVTPACNNNGTASDATDDYRTFSVTASGTGVAPTYNASVNNSGTLTPTSGSYGSATNFRLQNGSAGNGTVYTLTLTDATTSSCTQTATISDPGSCAVASCSLSVTATPGACSSATNTYNVTGQFTFANAPTSGTLSATIGASSSTPITMTGTTTSPQSYTITGLTADGASHTVSASFSASPTCTGSINYNAPASCTVTGQPDLQLTKTASITTVNSGQAFSYTLTLSNTGTLAATGVQVRDLLPASLTYVSSTASQGSYNNTTGIWTVGTVAIGASLTLTINVTVN